MIKSKLPIILGILVLLATIFTACSDGGGSTTTAVKVTDVTLKAGNSTSGTSTIYFNSTDANLPSSVTFTATVVPENATNKKVTWTVTPDTYVTWNETTRTATAKAVGGPTTVTVKTDDGAKTATWTITVADAASFVAVTGVSITPADELDFDKPVGSSAFEPPNATLTAVVLPEGVLDKGVVWKSDDEEVATVTNGVVTPVGKGITHISATSVTMGSDGEPVESTNKVKVEVTIGGEALIEVESISIAPAAGLTFNKPAGGSFTPATGALTATVLPANAWKTTVTWSSEDEGIATVDNHGVVTPVGNGSTYIVATSDGDSTKIAKAPVTVTVEGAATVPVESVAITPHTTIEFNKPHGGDFAPESVELEVTVHPTNATNKLVTWTSTNPAVATVNPTTGVVTPVGAGNAVIKVTSNADNSKTDQVNVTVTVEAAPITLKLVNQSATPAEGTTLTLPSMDATTKRYTIANAFNSFASNVTPWTGAGWAGGDATTGVTGTTVVYLDKGLGNNASISARVRITQTFGTGADSGGVIVGMFSNPVGESNAVASDIKFCGVRLNTNPSGEIRMYTTRDQGSSGGINNSASAFSPVLNNGYVDNEYIITVTRTAANTYNLKVADANGTQLASGTRGSNINQIIDLGSAYPGFIIARAKVEISQITVTEGTETIFQTANSTPAVYPVESIEFTAPLADATLDPSEFECGHSLLGGPLTISTKVLPTRATDKTVTWNVVSGSASLSANTGDSITATFSVAGDVVISATAGAKTIKLKVDVSAGAIPVESITISPAGGRTSITAGNGTALPQTLQFSEDIEPPSATDPVITWSLSATSTFDTLTTVEDCTISNTGLLTAPTNYMGADKTIYVFAKVNNGGEDILSDGIAITVKGFVYGLTSVAWGPSAVRSKAKAEYKDVGGGEKRLIIEGAGAFNSSNFYCNMVYVAVPTKGNVYKAEVDIDLAYSSMTVVDANSKLGIIAIIGADPSTWATGDTGPSVNAYMTHHQNGLLAQPFRAVKNPGFTGSTAFGSVPLATDIETLGITFDSASAKRCYHTQKIGNNPLVNERHNTDRFDTLATDNVYIGLIVSANGSNATTTASVMAVKALRIDFGSGFVNIPLDTVIEQK